MCSDMHLHPGAIVVARDTVQGMTRGNYYVVVAVHEDCLPFGTYRSHRLALIAPPMAGHAIRYAAPLGTRVEHTVQNAWIVTGETALVVCAVCGIATSARNGRCMHAVWSDHGAKEAVQ